ncbi:unnamed protein product, partial [Anisakis simplex]|uniref:C2H2-type domain-containing protein n=1 Tax=Anisakis simplex TaxID=6269 RepID=A0A0M3JHM9_ANISI
MDVCGRTFQRKVDRRRHRETRPNPTVINVRLFANLALSISFHGNFRIQSTITVREFATTASATVDSTISNFDSSPNTTNQPVHSERTIEEDLDGNNQEYNEYSPKKSGVVSFEASCYVTEKLYSLKRISEKGHSMEEFLAPCSKRSR